MSLSKHFVIRPSAVWMVTCVSSFVLSWWLFRVAAEHFGPQKTADVYTAIRQFKQDLAPNHANTRLVFCQDTERGVGIYFCSLESGQPRLLCEKKENALQWRRFSMLGWSPDDSLFACALPAEHQDKESILVFDGAKGERLAQVVVDQGLYQFTWLTTDAFAYSTHTDVRVVMRVGNGWEHKRYFEKVATKLENLVAFSDQSLVWQDAGDIWVFNLSTGTEPKKLWESTTNALVEFTYSRSSGELLLNCLDEEGQYLLRFNPQENRIIAAGRIGPYQDYIRNVLWTGYKTAYAFLTNNLSGCKFCINSSESSVVSIPWSGGVSSFTLNGQHLLFAGNPEEGIPGIWDYSLEDGEFRHVYSTTDSVGKSVTERPATCGVLTNLLGEQRFYHLWAPKHVSSGRKYPVMIAQEMDTWYPYFRIAAGCGYYVAVVDRPFSHTWNGSQQRTWTEDVQSLYGLIAKNPSIDSARAYFFAYSVETYYLSSLLSRNPDLWKGAVLFSPVSMPDVTMLRGKKVIIIAGEDDRGVIARSSEYQNQAAACGTPVTLCILPNAGHTPESVSSEQTRNRHLARFLSANRG